MLKKSNIFYNLTNGHEDNTTQLLCNLMQKKFFRDICLKYFGIENYNSILPKHIYPQYNINGVGRLDIFIENDNVLCLIENKINDQAPLQDSQIGPYVDFVAKRNKKEKKLIFLISDGYIHKNEIKKTIEKNQSVNIKIFYWEHFLNHLSEMEIDNCSSLIRDSLEYLKNLFSETGADSNLNPYEVALMYNPKDIYYVLSLLEKNINQINKAADPINLIGDQFSWAGPQSDKRGQGRYIKYKEKGCIFLGLNPGLRNIQNGDFVYSLAIPKSYIKDNYKEFIDQKFYPYIADNFPNDNDIDENYIYIKIDRKLFIDESRVNDLRDKVVEIIKEVFLKICNIESA